MYEIFKPQQVKIKICTKAKWTGQRKSNKNFFKLTRNGTVSKCVQNNRGNKIIHFIEHTKYY